MPPPTPTLCTSRLVLRPCNKHSRADADLVIRTFSDPFVGPWGFSGVGIHAHDDVVKKHQQHGPRNQPELCTRWMSEYGEVADVVYHLVYLKPENECGDSSGTAAYIGFVCMSFRSEVTWPDLGYALFEQYTGNGYASEAGKAVVEWWRGEVGVKEIWLGAADDNLASQRCARRIGFVEGGELRIRFGGGEEGVRKGRAFVLPGMKWPEYGLEIYVTLKKG